MKNDMFPMHALLSGDSGEGMTRFVFTALLSDNSGDLDAAIDRMNREGFGSDELRYNLIGLKAFREQQEENEEEGFLSPEQKALMEEYGDDWTFDLVGMINRYNHAIPSGRGSELGFVPH